MQPELFPILKLVPKLNLILLNYYDWNANKVLINIDIA